MISKSAHICEGAKLGKDVTVEPFAYIAADVEIGDGCWIGPGAVILDGARLGKNCKVHTAAVVAGLPQDLKFKGEYSTAVVGDQYDDSRVCDDQSGHGGQGRDQGRKQYADYGLCACRT